jgi:serine protease Do
LGFLMWPGVVLFPGGAERQAPLASSTPPTRADSPPTIGQAAVQLQPDVLADILNNSVVIIVGTDRETGTPMSGTGFFVTPTLFVTNRHLINKLDPNSLKVASKHLQPSQQPRIVAKSPDGDTRQVRDLALLSVEQPSRGFLKLGPSPPKVTPILSVAYPESFQDLGTDSVISRSIVNREDEPLPVKILIHSVVVGKGGAGGPIVDLCGRVVGVNTAVAPRPGKAPVTLAQDVTELQAFLSTSNAPATIDNAACPSAPAAAARQ